MPFHDIPIRPPWSPSKLRVRKTIPVFIGIDGLYSYEQYISHFDFQFSDDTLSYADKENNQPRQDEVVKIYDNMFILRVVLSLLLGLVALIVGTYTLLKHFCEQRYAEPVGRSKLVGWKELISLFTVYHQVFQLKNCMKYTEHSFWRINNLLLQINSWA